MCEGRNHVTSLGSGTSTGGPQEYYDRLKLLQKVNERRKHASASGSKQKEQIKVPHHAVRDVGCEQLRSML